MKTKSLFFILALFIPLLAFSQVRKVAILETVDKEGNVDYAHKLMLRSNLAKSITNTPGYEAYDRTDIDQIMGEQNFQRTGMVSDDQIRKLGEMTGAEFVLVAEAVRVDEKTMFITAKLLNVETTKTEKTDNILMSSTPADIQHGCEALAAKLFGVSSLSTKSGEEKEKSGMKNFFSNMFEGKDKKQEKEAARMAQQQIQNQSILTSPVQTMPVQPAPVQSAPIQASPVQQAQPIQIVVQAPAQVTTPQVSSVPMSVGQLKQFPDGSRGVVFYVDGSGHGLCVSLDEAATIWESAKKSKLHDIPNVPNISKMNSSNLVFQPGLGMNYTTSILQTVGIFPAASWCISHGNGWYLPSAGEIYYLLMVANQKDGKKGAISKALKAFGGIVLDGWYWVCEEEDEKTAWNMSVSGSICSENKYETSVKARAIRQF